MPPIVVFDVDGTLKQYTSDGIQQFRLLYTTSFSLRLEESALVRERTLREFAALELHIKENPARFGWWRKDKYVASASDVFLRLGEAARLMLDSRKFIIEPKARSQFLRDLYQTTYRRCSAGQFRSEALAVLQALRRRNLPIYFVTNSEAEEVVKSFLQFGECSSADDTNDLRWTTDVVIGGAQKFELTDFPADVPEYGYFEGLERRVYYRRGLYLKRLKDILARHPGSTFRDLIIVGDNGELDLLPYVRGARVILLPSLDTPDYEIAHFQSLHNGAVAMSLIQAFDKIIAWL